MFLPTICLVIALVLFIIAALNVATKTNLIAAGLALMVLAQLVVHIKI